MAGRREFTGVGIAAVGGFVAELLLVEDLLTLAACSLGSRPARGVDSLPGAIARRLRSLSTGASKRLRVVWPRSTCGSRRSETGDEP